MNRFTVEDEARSVEVFRVPTEVAEGQVARLNRLRAERDGTAVEAALERLRQAAAGDGNLLPPILEAVKTYATLGEICGALRQVFGEYREFVFVH